MHNIFSLIKKYSILVIGSLIFIAHIAYGQEFGNPFTSETFGDLVVNISYYVSIYSLPFLGLAIVYSGFLIVSARGNEEKLKSAKKIFYWTLVGTALVIASATIADIFVEFAGKISETTY